jgi:hypothetical protein
VATDEITIVELLAICRVTMSVDVGRGDALIFNEGVDFQ